MLGYGSNKFGGSPIIIEWDKIVTEIKNKTFHPSGSPGGSHGGSFCEQTEQVCEQSEQAPHRG